MYSGKIKNNGKTVKIKPDPWSIIVLFHNYLYQIDIGYETKEIQNGLSYLIHQDDDKLKDLKELYESGVLTEEEFNKAKKKLLN